MLLFAFAALTSTATVGQLALAPDPASQASQSPKTVTLTVKVTAAASKKAIHGARIFVRTENGEQLAESRTNKLGIAEIAGVPIARVKLQVIATAAWVSQAFVIDIASLKLPVVEFFLTPAQPPGLDSK